MAAFLPGGTCPLSYSLHLRQGYRVPTPGPTAEGVHLLRTPGECCMGTPKKRHRLPAAAQGGAQRRPDPHPCATWKPGAQRRGLPVARAGGWLSRQVRQDLHWSRRSLRKAGEAGGFSCRDRQQMLCTIKASDLQQVQRIRCCTARSISTQTLRKFRSTSRLENRRTEIPSLFRPEAFLVRSIRRKCTADEPPRLSAPGSAPCTPDAGADCTEADCFHLAEWPPSTPPASAAACGIVRHGEQGGAQRRPEPRPGACTVPRKLLLSGGKSGFSDISGGI